MKDLRLVLIAPAVLLAAMVACSDGTGSDASPVAATGTPTQSTVITTSTPEANQPTPTAAAAGSPNPTSTQAPPPASPTHSPATSFVEIVSVSSPVMRGSTATLVAQTTPSANCGITGTFSSGGVAASVAVARPADGDGRLAWTWDVPARAPIGDWQVTVTCDGASATTTISVLG